MLHDVIVHRCTLNLATIYKFCYMFEVFHALHTKCTYYNLRMRNSFTHTQHTVSSIFSFLSGESAKRATMLWYMPFSLGRSCLNIAKQL